MFVRFVLAFVCLLIVAVVGALVWPETAYERFEPSEAYRDMAERYRIPPMPPDWREHLFRTDDGTLLRWGETGNRNAAQVTLLVIPGYTATLDMYGEHVGRLAERGYHVMGVDLRGQGQSSRHRPHQPEKLHVDDFSTYSDDLVALIGAVAPGDTPIVLVGMSFGGHVAMRVGTDHPDVVDGLFLVAPALKPKAGDVDFGTALRQMNGMRFIGKSDRYLPGQGNWKPVGDDYTVASQDLCASNPDRLYLRDAIFTRQPQQRVGGVTAQWGAEFFESAKYLARDGRYATLPIPVHMVMAEVDSFVDNTAISKACDDIPNCTRKLMPGTGHCLFQESDVVLDEMFDDLGRLVERVVSSG